jgi:hypothetical protein
MTEQSKPGVLPDYMLKIINGEQSEKEAGEAYENSLKRWVLLSVLFFVQHAHVNPQVVERICREEERRRRACSRYTAV